MKETIETLKQLLNEELNQDGDWRTPYEKIIQSIYHQPVLFFALSKEKFNKERISSIPLVSTKNFDGAPSLYVFSDVDLASAWMSHYNYVTEDMKYGLIGAARKEDNDFLQIFQIAKYFGVRYIMLDEGGSSVGIKMDDFIHANKIDASNINVRVPMEEINRILANNEEPVLEFPEVYAIPLAK